MAPEGKEPYVGDLRAEDTLGVGTAERAVAPLAMTPVGGGDVEMEGERREPGGDGRGDAVVAMVG